MKDKYYMLVDLRSVTDSEWWTEAVVFADERNIDKEVKELIKGSDTCNESFVLMEVKPIKIMKTETISKILVTEESL